jgi:anti-sigma B factor antagonist
MMGYPVDTSSVDELVAPALLAIDRLDHADGTTLRLSGELDLSSARELEAAIGDVQASSRGPITLDLDALTFMDSSGLATLVRAQRAGRPVILAHLRDQARRLLELAGMLEHFDVRD